MAKVMYTINTRTPTNHSATIFTCFVNYGDSALNWCRPKVLGPKPKRRTGD